MFKLKYSVFFIIFALILGLSGVSFAANKAAVKSPAPEKKPAPIVVNINEANYQLVSPLDLVKSPNLYLNKDIKFKAKFDKFSTLGLDYKPAMRDSQKYIAFLIKRDDVKDYNIPLSELKLIIKRDYAEQEMIDTESSDEIEVYGKVFSTALNDPWLDVKKIKILTPKKPKNDNKAKSLED